MKVRAFLMTKIRDYNMNGTIILGVDAGYGNYKTARCCFPTSVSRSDQPPIFTRNYLEYEGGYYTIGEGARHPGDVGFARTGTEWRPQGFCGGKEQWINQWQSHWLDNYIRRTALAVLYPCRHRERAESEGTVHSKDTSCGGTSVKMGADAEGFIPGIYDAEPPCGLQVCWQALCG